MSPLIQRNGINLPDPLRDAVDWAFQTNKTLVDRFGLGVRWDGIIHEGGLWTVPVASGVQQGSARELLSALSTLGDSIEARFAEPVSVIFDPGDASAQAEKR